ncbi:hypothetical protein V8C86DRAFT_698911 [Haematococcus lacustris]
MPCKLWLAPGGPALVVLNPLLFLSPHVTAAAGHAAPHCAAGPVWWLDQCDPSAARSAPGAPHCCYFPPAPPPPAPPLPCCPCPPLHVHALWCPLQLLSERGAPRAALTAGHNVVVRAVAQQDAARAYALLEALLAPGSRVAVQQGTVSGSQATCGSHWSKEGAGGQGK